MSPFSRELSFIEQEKVLFYFFSTDLKNEISNDEMFVVIDVSIEDGISNISHLTETENTTQKKDISVVYVKSTVNNGT